MLKLNFRVLIEDIFIFNGKVYNYFELCSMFINIFILKCFMAIATQFASLIR